MTGGLATSLRDLRTYPRSLWVLFIGIVGSRVSLPPRKRPPPLTARGRFPDCQPKIAVYLH